MVDIAAFSPTADSLGSIAYSRPAIEKAVEDMNTQFNGTLQLSVTFISGSNLSCKPFQDEVVNLLAKWYYVQRRPRTKAVSLVMNTGSVGFRKGFLHSGTQMMLTF